MKFNLKILNLTLKIYLKGTENIKRNQSDTSVIEHDSEINEALKKAR